MCCPALLSSVTALVLPAAAARARVVAAYLRPFALHRRRNGLLEPVAPNFNEVAGEVFTNFCEQPRFFGVAHPLLTGFQRELLRLTGEREEREEQVVEILGLDLLIPRRIGEVDAGEIAIGPRREVFVLAAVEDEVEALAFVQLARRVLREALEKVRDRLDIFHAAGRG